jgi:hypothetical protein
MTSEIQFLSRFRSVLPDCSIKKKQGSRAVPCFFVIVPLGIETMSKEISMIPSGMIDIPYEILLQNKGMITIPWGTTSIP